MRKRVPNNPNQKRYLLPSYKGLQVINHRGPLVEGILERIFKTIECALAQYPQVFAFRVDLHLPKGSQHWPSNVISGFRDSFEEKIKAYLKRTEYPEDACDVRIIWAKERKSSHNVHYHAILLLNKRVFFRSGAIDSERTNLASRVKEAWASALKMRVEDVRGLIHFVDNRDYIVNRHSPDFLQQLANLFYRASYLAKEETKEYGDGTHHFGCSHFTPLPMEFSLDEIIQFHRYCQFRMPAESFITSSEYVQRSHWSRIVKGKLLWLMPDCTEARQLDNFYSGSLWNERNYRSSPCES